MTDKDYELLSQYIDSELSPGAADVLRQRLTKEPGLQANLERMQAVDQSLQMAFSGPDSGRVPTEVIDLLQPEPTGARVIPFPSRKSRSGWGFAIAASLVAACGLVLTQDWQNGATISLDSMDGDALLSQMLDQSPSRGDAWEDLSDGRQFRAVLSFPHITGHWCREYLMSEDTGLSRGVACRTEGKWITHVSVPDHSLNGSSSEYRPAGANNPSSIAEFIDSFANDIPLDANQEAELIAEGWE
jgi:hypothetical protein